MGQNVITFKWQQFRSSETHKHKEEKRTRVIISHYYYVLYLTGLFFRHHLLKSLDLREMAKSLIFQRNWLILGWQEVSEL